MKRLIVVILAALIFLVPQPVRTADLAFLDSVFPLTLPVTDTNGIGLLHNACTVVSIGDKEWLTAGHCVSDYAKYRYYVMGDEASVVKIDLVADLAKVTTERATAPVIHLATVAPEILDPIIAAGYPLGYKNVNVTTGTISGFQHMDIEGVTWNFLFLAITGAPGNSGAPVLNTNHELVSIMQGGYSHDSFSSQAYGVPFDTLKTFLGQ